MIWSTFQERIFEEIQLSEENLIIKGVAGCGKTTTIEEIARRLPSTKHVVFLAFNKSIAQELAIQLPEIKCVTFHALGYEMIRNNLGYRKVNGRKISNLLRFEYLNWNTEDAETKKVVNNNIDSVERIIAICKGSMFTEQKTLKHSLVQEVSARWETIASEYCVDTPNIEFLKSTIPAIFELSITKTQTIDFNDMLYYPILFDWEFPVFDYVIVDECQDLNAIQREYVLRLSGNK